MLGGWLEKIERSEAAGRKPSRHLACAVLLLECARADFESSEVELHAVRRVLRDQLGVAPEAVEELLGEAGRAATRAVSLHEFVSRLNRELSAEERRGLIGMLWRVAYADGRVDPQEEALLRMLADLLFVPHAHFMQEKLAAMPGA